VAAALQKASVCAPKLGYRTSQTDVLRYMRRGLRRARSFSATAPPVRVGGVAIAFVECRLVIPSDKADCLYSYQKAGKNLLSTFYGDAWRSGGGAMDSGPLCLGLYIVNL
jgi:hypothetical protein